MSLGESAWIIQLYFPGRLRIHFLICLLKFLRFNSESKEVKASKEVIRVLMEMFYTSIWL